MVAAGFGEPPLRLGSGQAPGGLGAFCCREFIRRVRFSFTGSRRLQLQFHRELPRLVDA